MKKILLVLTLALAGCASSVERSYRECLVFGGNAVYMEAGDARKVACARH